MGSRIARGAAVVAMTLSIITCDGPTVNSTTYLERIKAHIANVAPLVEPILKIKHGNGQKQDLAAQAQVSHDARSAPPTQAFYDGNNMQCIDKEDAKADAGQAPAAKDTATIIAEAKAFFEAKKKVIPKSLQHGNMIYVDLTTRYLYVLDSDFSVLISEIPVAIGAGGIGTEPGSLKTPTGAFSGQFEVSKCLGCTLRVIKKVPMITSVAIWLHGLEKENSNSFKRGIGIHAFPGEWLATGRGNSSWGCIVTTDYDIWDLATRIGAKTNDRILVLVNDI